MLGKETVSAGGTPEFTAISTFFYFFSFETVVVVGGGWGGRQPCLRLVIRFTDQTWDVRLLDMLVEAAPVTGDSESKCQSVCAGQTLSVFTDVLPYAAAAVGADIRSELGAWAVSWSSRSHQALPTLGFSIAWRDTVGSLEICVNSYKKLFDFILKRTACDVCHSGRLKEIEKWHLKLESFSFLLGYTLICLSLLISSLSFSRWIIASSKQSHRPLQK